MLRVKCPDYVITPTMSSLKAVPDRFFVKFKNWKRNFIVKLFLVVVLNEFLAWWAQASRHPFPMVSKTSHRKYWFIILKWSKVFENRSDLSSVLAHLCSLFGFNFCYCNCHWSVKRTKRGCDWLVFENEWFTPVPGKLKDDQLDDRNDWIVLRLAEVIDNLNVFLLAEFKLSMLVEVTN